MPKPTLKFIFGAVFEFVVPIFEPNACFLARSFANILGSSLYVCLIRSIIPSSGGLDPKLGSLGGKGSRFGGWGLVGRLLG